ncbi:hypothetical protein MXB_340 [Myxobolus squamalis]|nr:hypothetical protein MXB_340 [Myxobolus squamalis]
MSKAVVHCSEHFSEYLQSISSSDDRIKIVIGQYWNNSYYLLYSVPFIPTMDCMTLVSFKDALKLQIQALNYMLPGGMCVLGFLDNNGFQKSPVLSLIEIFQSVSQAYPYSLLTSNTRPILVEVSTSWFTN